MVLSNVAASAWEVKAMNQLGFGKQPQDPNDCAQHMTMAERELAAFFGAVTEFFGSEQAGLTAEEWLCELEAVDELPASTREWRLMTTKASARLANRVNASSLSTEFATT